MIWSRRCPKALRKYSRTTRRRAMAIINGLVNQHYSESRAVSLALAIIHAELFQVRCKPVG